MKNKKWNNKLIYQEEIHYYKNKIVFYQMKNKVIKIILVQKGEFQGVIGLQLKCKNHNF